MANMQLQQQRTSRPSAQSRRSVRPSALFSKKPSTATVEKAEAKAPPKQSALSQTLNAFDFTSTRSAKDADLLYEAKYGKRGEDGRMTPEQYQALRRKVIGTSRDFWKDWVEEEQVKNIKTYYKPDEAGGSVPYLPFLVGVVLAMLATTAVVVSQTS